MPDRQLSPSLLLFAALHESAGPSRWLAAAFQNSIAIEKLRSLANRPPGSVQFLGPSQGA